MLYFIFYAFLFCFLSAYFAFYAFLRFFFGVLCMYMHACVCVYILIERAHARIHTDEEAARSVAVDFNVNAILGLPTVRPTVLH